MRGGLRDKLAEISNLPLPLSIMQIEGCLFKCKRCGHCCQEITGVVLSDGDIERIAKFTHHGTGWIARNMTEPNPKDPKHPFIKDTKTKGYCPYYENGCTIYEARPIICRAYPCNNPEGGGLNPHLYWDCPGVVEMVQEIQVEQFLIGDTQPSFDDAMIWEVIRIMAFTRTIQLEGLSNDVDWVRDLTKLFKDWNRIEADFRKHALRLLAYKAPKETIDSFLCEYEKAASR